VDDMTVIGYGLRQATHGLVVWLLNSERPQTNNTPPHTHRILYHCCGWI